MEPIQDLQAVESCKTVNLTRFTKFGAWHYPTGTLVVNERSRSILSVHLINGTELNHWWRHESRVLDWRMELESPSQYKMKVTLGISQVQSMWDGMTLGRGWQWAMGCNEPGTDNEHWSGKWTLRWQWAIQWQWAMNNGWQITMN